MGIRRRRAAVAAVAAASALAFSGAGVSASGTPPTEIRVDLGIGAVVHGLPGPQPLPVVIFGSAATPADEIDAETVLLDGRPVVRVDGVPWQRMADVDGDGHDDLLVIGKVVNPPPQTYVAKVTAATVGGAPVAGSDEIQVLAPHMQSGL